MKKLSISVALLSLVGAFALPAATQIIPPWDIGDQAPPLSDRKPDEVNPFLDTLNVTLDAAGATKIYYDINNTAEFDPEAAVELVPGLSIPLASTSILRAVAYSPTGRYSGLATWTYAKDVAPVVAFTNPPAGANILRGTTVTLKVSASDPDGPLPLSVAYQYSQAAGGAWVDLGEGAGSGFSLAWPIADDFTTGATQLRAVATDGRGASAVHQINITISAPINQPPVVTLVNPVNNTFYITPTTVQLSATASDPDDPTASAITKVEFYKNGETTPFASTLSAPWTYSWVDPAPGAYSLTAVAYDNGTPQLHTTSAAVSITVAANRMPKPTIVFPENGKTYYAPFIDSVRASVTDSDGNASVVEVVFKNGDIIENTDITQPSWAYKKPYPAGTYKFTATAKDNLGGIGVSDTVRITVADNQAPIANAGDDITLLWPANIAALKGNTSSDPEGTDLKYEWSGPAGVTFTGGTTATPNATISAPGAYTITLKVTDLGTPASSSTDQVLVTVNSKPLINSPLTASGQAGVRFGYLMTATGYPAPALSATKPTWLTQKAGTDSLVGTPPASGQVTVTLSAVNGSGTDTKILNISISDSAFKPTITSALTGTAKMGIAYSYTITANGNPSPTYSTSTLPAGLNFTAAGGLISGTPTVSGIHTINLTATNSKGSDTKALQLTINSDPKITTNLLDSIVITENGRAAFEVKTTGFPAVTYEWQYGAAAAGPFSKVGSNSSMYVIDPATLTSAGYYRVIVRNGSGPDVTSKVCRLKVNALPIPIRITASPTPMNTVVGNLAQFKARATGQPKLMFQWFRGSTAVTPAPKELDTVFIIQKVATADSGVYRVRVTNSFTDLSKPETYAYSDTARLVVQLPKLPEPYARPSGGPFYPTTRIAFGNDTTGTSIYWTDNGSDPSPINGYLFNGDSIQVNITKSFKARAYKANFRPSDIKWVQYTLTAPGTVIKPQIKPPTPTFKVSMTCTLSTATPGATLYYTRDGSDPRIGTPLSGAAITLDRTTTIIAVAKKDGMITSDTLKMTYTLETIASKVLTPTITAGGNDFSGTMKAYLDCATDSSSIYYTTDWTSPDSSATRILYDKDTPVSLSSTTTLRVVATRKNFLNSDMVTRTFRLLPGPITATPAPDLIFPEASITIRLAAQPAGSTIRYTTEGTPNPESPEFPADGLNITGTTTISAIAVKDGISSTVYSFSYTKKGGQLATPTPTTANNQSTFKDTVRISLYSTPGSEIYYTLNGDIPTAISANKYGSPFLIDSTVTLQAVAMQNGYSNSKILVATYTLAPERPTASPPGGSSPNAVNVKLKCSSRRATLYYTLDGNDPTPSNRLLYDSAQGIPITTTNVLKAIAVAGNTASPVMEENYVIFGVQNFDLPPGQTAFLEGGYTLRSPEDQSATVQGRIAGATPFNLVGFDGVQYILTLALADKEAYTGVEFPKLTFTSPSADKRSMYKIDLSGKIYFISGADTVSLQQPGSYFMGIDVSPPTIRHAGEAFAEKDSTQITLQIDDNIANLSYDLKRNDDPTLNLGQQFVFSGQNLTFKLKHPNGTLKPLQLQVIVSDYRTATFFPPDPVTMFPLSQRMGSIKSPDAWFIGANQESPFDFLSVPLDLEVPLTLKSLRTANPGGSVEGVAWNKDLGKYLPIPETETIRPGQGYWVGSRSRISSLSLASVVTVPRPNATFSVILKTGWNQIGNPHLEELFWPYSRTQEEAYKGFPIKGLWEYNAIEAKFIEAESLKPWRGYFVFNHLGETSVTLSPRPVAVWAMRKYGNAGQARLSLGWGDSPSLRLGADHLSSDGLGREDEFSLPHRGGLSIRSLRNGASLNSDWVRLRTDGIQEWKIAMEVTGTSDSLPSLRILTQEIPDGHETWAVSLSRSLKFRMEQGREIPASGLAKDTLLIYSGHKDQLARFGLLQAMSLVAPSLDMNVSSRNGGFTLRMSLPSKARIHATVWSLQGTHLGEMVLGPLSGGNYGFAYETDFRNRPARLTPGIYFLSLEVRGAGLQKRLARKIVIRD